MKTLKIGLLVPSRFSSKYVYDLVDWANKQSNIEISHLILCTTSRKNVRFGVDGLFATKGLYAVTSRLLFRLIISAEQLVLNALESYRYQLDLLDLTPLVKHELTVEPAVSMPGSICFLSSDQSNAVRQLELDLLISCGSWTLRGDILNASRLGVIAIRFGDDRANWDAPPGFWECYHKSSRTSFTIQRLTEELDGGDILLRASFCTQFFCALNQAHLFKKASIHLQGLLAQIASTHQLPPTAPSLPYSGPLRRTPAFHQGVAYAFKMIGRVSKELLARLVGLRERWGISLLQADWKKAVFSRSVRVAFPRGRFWADPFLYVHNGKTYCFVEDYVYRSRRGHITALEVCGTEVVELGACLREPFHLSFPFLFRYNEGIYMCPEAYESKQIRIYRCLDFPLNWTLSAVVMENVSASDTVLFEKAGKWWMLTSIDKSGTNDWSSELYLFCSSSPLESDWRPHPQNPIRIDSDGGRNAGLILEGDRVLRIAQRQGYGQYGLGLLVYEITEISESRFAEKLVSRIDPEFRRGLLGVHHLSSTGATTVIDHASRSFVFPALGRSIRQMLREHTEKKLRREHVAS
ncbi:MAG: hypothetical protein EPO21_16280 [Chloroflexota bacterium]|nr:MAG: hypothetical protein EPO21_16280 [Chloroflexota bacterium]